MKFFFHQCLIVNIILSLITRVSYLILVQHSHTVQGHILLNLQRLQPGFLSWSYFMMKRFLFFFLKSKGCSTCMTCFIKKKKEINKINRVFFKLCITQSYLHGVPDQNISSRPVQTSEVSILTKWHQLNIVSPGSQYKHVANIT